MNWLPGDRYYQRSDCGRYTVAKVGNGTEFRYESWRTRAHPEGPHLVAANLPTADDARRLCEEDSHA